MYKSSLGDGLVAAVAFLHLGNEFSGFMRWGLPHHSTNPGGRRRLQSKRNPIPTRKALLYQTPAYSSDLLTLPKISFRATGKKRPSTFWQSEPMGCLFFLWSLVCAMWLSNFGEWEETQKASETHLHCNLQIFCMSNFHANDLEENINNMIMNHLHTLLSMLSVQTRHFVQSSLSANRKAEQALQVTLTLKIPADSWKHWQKAWLFCKISWIPDHNERQWDLGTVKMLLSFQSLISLYFHLSSPDDFLHAVAFPKQKKKQIP